MGKQLKIWTLVILAVGLALWGARFLKGYNFFADEVVYHARYENVQGLTESNPIYFQGLKVGQVSEVVIVFDSLLQRNVIDVSLLVTNKSVSMSDSTIARIGGDGLLGSRCIRLEKVGKGKLLPAGGFLMSEIEKDLQAQINETLLPLKKSTEKLIESAEQLITSFKVVMNDETKENLMEAFRTIPQTIKNLEHATFTIDTTVQVSGEKMKAIFAHVESITKNLQQNNGKITSIMSNLDEITDSLAKSNFQETILTVTSTLKKTDTILGKINRGEGTMGQLINNDRLYNELTLASVRLNMLINDLQENPQKYINLSLVDFRGHHKQAENDSVFVIEQMRRDSVIIKKYGK